MASASRQQCLSEIQTVVSGLPGGDPTFSCFDSILACDRQMDRRTYGPRVRQAKYSAAMLSCVKKI